MSETTCENLNFEAAMSELEKIVAAMERGDMELEKLVEAYARGRELENAARRKLEEMKKKIEVLADRSEPLWQDFSEGGAREHGGEK